VAWHAFLPAMTIVITSIGGWILTMRNTMITTLAEDYVMIVLAKGLSLVRIMLMYAGRNAILLNLTGFAMSLGFVISGAILVEIVFNYPGLGFMLLQAVNSEDFALMQALFLLITLSVLVAVLTADLITAWLDPRIRQASVGLDAYGNSHRHRPAGSGSTGGLYPLWRARYSAPCAGLQPQGPDRLHRAWRVHARGGLRTGHRPV
jgi:hypothetical protein